MGSADPTKRTLSNLKTHIRMKHIADWEILKNLLGLRQQNFFEKGAKKKINSKFFLFSISGKLKSPVWNFYLPPGNNDKFATCKICGEEKSTGSVDPVKRTLVNLKRHIQSKHKVEWEYLNLQLAPNRKQIYNDYKIENCQGGKIILN